MHIENIISVDFDGTLDHHFGGKEKNTYLKEVRDYIIRLKRRGYDVWIITRRFGPENFTLGIQNEHLKVWDVAQELGISRNRIIFTNREWKFSFIERIGAFMHIDDDVEEKKLIEKNLPEVKIIWLGNNDWEELLISKIEEHDPVKIWFSEEKNYIVLGLSIILVLAIIICFS